jgi:hypothetical protein
MHKREWALLILIYLVLAEVLSWYPVPDLSLCLIQPEHSQQTSDHDKNKYCPPFHMGIIGSLDAVDGFLERHDKSVVGGFTIVLAISTIGLWLATNNLWRAGEEQRASSERIAAQQRSSDRRIADEQFRQMRYSNEASFNAASAAAQSARAATASNQIAITTAEQELRAYVTAKDVNLIVHRDPPRMTLNGLIDGEINTYGMAPVLHNGGQTPATNVVINASTQQFPGEIPASFEFPDSENFGHGVIGPQCELHGPAAEISAGELDPMRNPSNWYMWGWVEYDDIFSGTMRHRTEFCFQIQRVRPPVTGQLWIGFRPLPRFNAVDGDCLRPINPAT